MKSENGGNVWFKRWWPLLVILFMVLINWFPAKQSMVLGDFYQLTNIKDHFIDYFYTWFNNAGQGMYNPVVTAMPFYLIQHALGHFGISHGLWLSSWLLIFFLASYFSFRGALKILFSLSEEQPKKGDIEAVALLYVLNTFILCIFQYGWGYTHHFLIYIFAPLLLASFVRFMVKPSYQNLWWHTLIFFVSTIAFNNIAFFVAIVLTQLIMGLTLVLVGRFKGFLKIVKSLFAVLLVQGGLILYFFIPQLLAERSDIKTFINVGEAQLKTDPLALSKLFSLRTLTGFFPNRWVGDKILAHLVTDYLYYLPWVLIAFFLYLFWRKREVNSWRRPIIWVYLVPLVIFAVLAVRQGAPFAKLNLFIYNLPGFSFFRSADKAQTIYTVLFITVLAQAILSIKKERVRYLVLALVLLLPYPIYTGRIARDSTVLHDRETWDISNSGYGLGVKIPDEYVEAKAVIDQDNTDTAVISIPYAVENSFNWSTYPSWHLIGQDVLYQVYRRHYISANSYTNPSLESHFVFAEINKDELSEEDLIRAFQQYAGRYVMWHKDVAPLWLAKSGHIDGLVNNLANQGVLKKIRDNQYFTLYELADEYQVPLITSSNTVRYQRLNPTKYQLVIEGVKGDVSIQFRQTYSSQWKIYAGDIKDSYACPMTRSYLGGQSSSCEPLKRYGRFDDLLTIGKKPVPNEHKVYEDYANEWVISQAEIDRLPARSVIKNSNGTYTLVLVMSYLPQSYYYLGILIAFVILIIVYKLSKKNARTIS